ncbi:MAG: hypothetical protein Q7J29_01245 [Stagnimonas sp.]|nr:hypothetical protein [Stagnimonas sp.]
MYEQSPTLGPGMGTVTQHSAEILLLLAGAFLLGVLLHWLLSRATVLRLRQLTQELARTKERLTVAERRPQSTARLRESNSTEHERTLKQLRESREAEARTRERLIEIEGRLALAEAANSAANAAPAADVLNAVLPFVASDKPRKK